MSRSAGGSPGLAGDRSVHRFRGIGHFFRKERLRENDPIEPDRRFGSTHFRGNPNRGQEYLLPDGKRKDPVSEARGGDRFPIFQPDPHVDGGRKYCLAPLVGWIFSRGGQALCGGPFNANGSDPSKDPSGT